MTGSRFIFGNVAHGQCRNALLSPAIHRLGTEPQTIIELKQFEEVCQAAA